MFTKEQMEWVRSNLNFTNLNDMLAAAKQHFGDDEIVPTLVVAGRTGAGKSSLINAMVGRPVAEVGVIPTTQEAVGYDALYGNTPLRVVDLPGVGEAGKHGQCMESLLGQLTHAHILLMVIACPDRSLAYECNLLREVQQAYAGRLPLPLLVAGTKIDCAPPAREWAPSQLNIRTPQTEKERHIAQWLGYVGSILQPFMADNTDIIGCASGMAYNDTALQFGIHNVRQRVYDLLPDAARTYFARLTQDQALIDKRAANIVRLFSGMAGAAAAQPLPNVPDAALIMPIQAAMLVRLTRLHGKELTADMAAKLLGPLMARVAGRFAFEQLCKCVPVVGSVAGAAVATSMTYALGMGYHTLLLGGNWEFDADMLKDEVMRWWGKGGE